MQEVPFQQCDNHWSPNTDVSCLVNFESTNKTVNLVINSQESLAELCFVLGKMFYTFEERNRTASNKIFVASIDLNPQEGYFVPIDNKLSQVYLEFALCLASVMERESIPFKPLLDNFESLKAEFTERLKGLNAHEKADSFFDSLYELSWVEALHSYNILRPLEGADPTSLEAQETIDSLLDNTEMKLALYEGTFGNELRLFVNQVFRTEPWSTRIDGVVKAWTELEPVDRLEGTRVLSKVAGLFRNETARKGANVFEFRRSDNGQEEQRDA